ncbi:hypothetical protein EVAR_52458_1 [Eumeta japonica]|uniref:Uncharacterized protein n=1 Tax=Eumeta variegata TaxID=151549 RepID=A0A4C1Z3W5_EUMVA|nr:hypothetical protein EVAR_52458_1 [Eumeta japonica]
MLQENNLFRYECVPHSCRRNSRATRKPVPTPEPETSRGCALPKFRPSQTTKGRTYAQKLQRSVNDFGSIKRPTPGKDEAVWSVSADSVRPGSEYTRPVITRTRHGYHSLTRFGLKSSSLTLPSSVVDVITAPASRRTEP